MKAVTEQMVKPIQPIRGARVLVMVGDSVTTDHISPAGSIKKDSPTGRYLIEHGVQPMDFNSYGARRGNDRVMTRGTFANIRLRNLLAPGTEGGVTKYLPTGEIMSIYDAAMRYQGEGTPLVVLAGKDYGMGSSRDWAAKGPLLLGVKAVIAESYERIHRSNLVGMGILPLQFKRGESRETLGLDGTETYDIVGLTQGLAPRMGATLVVHRRSGDVTEVPLTVRTGLRLLLDRRVPLAGAVGSVRPLELELAAPREAATGGPKLADFFDDQGLSLVAGRAAFVRAGEDPRRAIEYAVEAGARAVVVRGTQLPAGGLGLDEAVDVPIVSVPRRARAAMSWLRTSTCIGGLAWSPATAR